MIKELDGIENLLIRACKTNKTERLTSVYKRFYHRDCTHEEIRNNLIAILSSLVDKVCTITTLELFKELDPKHHRHWAFGDECYDYNNECFNFLVNKLRFLHHKQLVELGYRVPRKYVPVDFENKTINNSYLAAENLRKVLRKIGVNETWIVAEGVDIQCFDYEVNSVLRVINLLQNTLDYVSITLTVRTNIVSNKVESSIKDLIRKEGQPITIRT